MSVINKMLRDLDKRQGRSGVPGLTDPVLRDGTVSVSVADSRARHRRALLGVLLLVALAAVLVGFWPAQSPPSQRPQAVSSAAVSPALAPASAAPSMPAASAPVAPTVLAAASAAQAVTPLASSAASAPLSAAMSAASAPRVAAAASGPLSPAAMLPAAGAASAAVVARVAASAAIAAPAKPAAAPTAVNAAPAQTPGASAAVPVPAKPVPAAVPASAALPARAASAPVAVLPAKAPSAAAPAVVAPSGVAASPAVAASGADLAQLAQRQQLAVAETLAQAQGLWNSGARDAGIDMLLQAVASLERSAANNPAAGTSLATLARELARMQLAQARPGAVWELLSRLEPYLRTDADLWAVRANAAQRLGRHQESVHAYMIALQMRPSEQRWLLGAAVSLAAMGQTASASDMAQKARAAGPISADVLAYLRQMGVQVKEP